MRALIGDAEAVLVRDAELPVGVITRSDVVGIARTAIGRASASAIGGARP
jgi:predicted transcriptional regulator